MADEADHLRERLAIELVGKKIRLPSNVVCKILRVDLVELEHENGKIIPHYVALVLDDKNRLDEIPLIGSFLLESVP